MSADPQMQTQYRYLRHEVGAYRRPREVLRVVGPDAAGYLQGQLSQDLRGLAPEGVVDSLVLAPDGKLDALVRVVRMGEELFYVDVDGGHGQALLARLERFKLRSRLELSLTEWSCVAIRGPRWKEVVGLSAAVTAPFLWGGWSGVDLLGPAQSIVVPSSVPWCGDLAWEAARIEAGLPVMGQEILEGVIPAELGLVEATVSFTKGCFTGQELVARIDARAGAVPHHLAGLVLEEPFEPALLVGAPLAPSSEDRPLGRVTSASWCPGVDAVCALAFVHRSVAADARVQVVVADRPRTSAPWARVQSLPLAARG